MSWSSFFFHSHKWKPIFIQIFMMSRLTSDSSTHTLGYLIVIHVSPQYLQHLVPVRVIIVLWSRFTCVSFLFHFTFLLISLLVFGDYLGDVGVLQCNHLDHSHVAVSASSWWLSWKRLNIRTDVFELTVISLMWITREKGQLWKVSRSNLCVKTLLSNIRQLPLPPVQMSQSSHCCPFLKHLKHF